MITRAAKRALPVLAGIFAGALLIFLFLAFSPFPELDAFVSRPCSTRMYDRNGVLLQVIPLENGLRREWLDLDDIPARAQEVFIAAEDKNFLRHFGIDPLAVARAARQNTAAGRPVSGASTITMQLARLVVPRVPGKAVTFGTKIGEALNALRLEARLSKRRILELYLNSLPFGSNAEGIASAARTFFGATPSALTDAQIHALAVIPRRPALYNPASASREAAYSAARDIGKTTGFAATREEWDAAMEGAGTYAYPYLLPHFVRYVVGRRTEDGGLRKPELSESPTPPFRSIPTPQSSVLSPSLSILTPQSSILLSIDSSLSLEAERLIRSRLEENKDARITNGAAVLIDNRTGEILVWADAAAAKNGDPAASGGDIDGVLVKNQSGSAMKPFLYALALEMGFAPSTVLPDVPSDFGRGEVYVPLNFNNRYNGPVLFRNALASSLNVPAVYLLYHAGIDNYLAKLSALGFDSLAGTRERAGLSLALGSGEVTLSEMVRAFSVFPRDGVLPELRIEKSEGGSLPPGSRQALPVAPTPPSQPVFKRDTARIICSFLSDRRARASGFAFSATLAPPYPAMFKTGTANQFQDIIALGATPRWTAGVWMGNFSGETVVGKTGSSIPAEVVRALFDTLVARERLAGIPPENFKAPETFALADVCALSGLAPNGDCPSVTREFARLGIALQPCTWHARESGRVVTRYPGGYQRWLSGKNSSSALFDGDAPLSFLYPGDGAVFVYVPAQSALTAGEHAPGASQQIAVDCAGGKAGAARLFVNGNFFAESARPFSWNVPLARGPMTLSVECAGETARIDIVVK